MNESLRTRLSAIGRKTGKWAVLVGAVVIGIVVGVLVRPAGPSRPEAPTSQPSQASQPTRLWTCAMHPEVRLPEPGRCPKCGMPLIPLEVGEAETARVPRLTVTPEARALMGIETAAVERKFVTAEVRMVGKVDFDETRQATITAWVPGRLDRLYVDYTGLPVRKGEHMVLLYSPELLSAQEELIQALAAVKNLSGSNVDIVRDTAQATVVAVRDKLRLLGLTAEQIAEVEQTGQASDHVTIYAPVSGIVIRKDALEGMYVATGTPIYTIADLSSVWVKLDAYESDLAWLRYGQRVDFVTVSYPGEVFTGTIAFIDPVLNERTRTAKVRLDVPNADGRLKPEMFVKAVVRAQVAAGGKVMDADLAGKWICPMHPSVVKTSAGTCDICGMPLVTTESLGYVSAGAAAEAPLVIPASAALTTGKRAIVYVETEGTDQPTFEGREVLLGPRAGDWYLVRGGLREGERVVTRGNFKIDSALQIQARPSMMSAEQPGSGEATSMPAAATAPAAGLEVPAAFAAQFGRVLGAYLAVGEALARDDVAGAIAAAGQARAALKEVDMALLSGEAHEAWMESAGALDAALGELVGAADIEAARKAMATVSELMIVAAKRFGPGGGAPLVRLHCPMAFDGRGADWLQRDRAVHNPYFGSAMPLCGEVVETIGAVASSGPAEAAGHE